MLLKKETKANKRSDWKSFHNEEDERQFWEVVTDNRFHRMGYISSLEK